MTRPSPLPPIQAHGPAANASPLSGWVRRAFQRWVSQGTYSTEEVLQRLCSDDPTGPRTVTVQTAARQTAAWSALLPAAAARDLGPSGSRLPSVVFWYRQGLDFAHMGQRLSPFAGAWDAERATMAACGLIAGLLNRTRPRTVAPGRWTRRPSENP